MAILSASGSPATALTTTQVDEILRGVRAGRSLKQIEEALSISAVSFLELVERDEGVNIRFKASQALSAYSLGAELMEKLRENLETPVSAVKNNALKLFMDHVHKEMDARNPTIYSGKAPINVSVPIQITTSLDLGQQKTLEGVYELKAEHIHELETEKLQISADTAGGSEPGRVETAGAEDSSDDEATNPFQKAISDQKISAAEPGKGPASDSGDAKVGTRKPRRKTKARNNQTSAISNAPSNGSGDRTSQEQVGDAEEASP